MMAWDYRGIGKRLNQLTGARPEVAYRGLKNLDELIRIELLGTSNEEEINTLLTYRRKVRMQLRRVLRAA